MIGAFPVMSGSGASSDEGYAILSQGRWFFDFTTASGNHLSTLTSFTDLTGNGRNLTNSPSGYTATAPKKFDYKTAIKQTVKCFSPKDSNPFCFATNSSSVNSSLSSSHDLHFSFVYRGKGFIAPIAGINSTQIYYVQIETDGKISIFIKRSTNTTRVRSVAAVLNQSVQNTDIGGLVYLRIMPRFESGSEALRLQVNRCEVAMELVSGDALASWNPSYNWNNAFSFGIGAVLAAVNVNIGSTGKDYWIFRAACTAPLTDDQANKVAHTMMLQPTPGVGALRHIADYSYLPFCTTSKDFKDGLYWSTQPSANVTLTVTGDSEVSISGSPFTFTNSNYNTPQLLKVVATLRKGYEAKNLTFTWTSTDPNFNGTEQKTIRITESYSGTNLDFGSDYYVTDGYCSCLYETDNFGNPQDIINDYVGRVFKGTTPTGTYQSSQTVTNFAGVNLVNANISVSTLYIFQETDIDGNTWSNQVLFAKNIQNNVGLFCDHFGHGETGHQAMFDAIVTTGCDFVIFNLANTGPNTTNNSTITQGSAAGHNQMFTGGLDRTSYMPKRLFFGEKVRFLDYIVPLQSYGDRIFPCGLSGGGQTVGESLLFESRFGVSFVVRGWNSNKIPGIGGDYEQGGSFYTESIGGTAASETNSGPRVIQLYRDLPTQHLMICGSIGRTVYYISHEDDQTGGGRRYPEIYKDQIAEIAAGFGGTIIHYVSNAVGESSHGYGTSDIAYIKARVQENI